MEDQENLKNLRHSAAHLLAAAVLKRFPGTKIDIGPATDSGFYYDFDSDHHFTAEDLVQLEQDIRQLIADDIPFLREEISREEARRLFQKGDQKFKMERLADIGEGETISIYRTGTFVDLCCGPHVKSTAEIGAVKLLSIAGTYYRGNEANPQLQRIYGTAFPSAAELECHLQQLEEAKKRDHRRLGKELKLFTIDEEVGAGMILWLPRGTIIRQELQKFISDELVKQGYQQVVTPHIAKLDLFRTSGHFPYYRDSQFSPLLDREHLPDNLRYDEVAKKLETGELEGFLLKPMNCPGHIKIYASSPKSYRELPYRLAEFGTVYRWEQSGELNGMTRVRGFTQDDAHIFCTEAQLESEIEGCIALVNKIFDTLGIGKYRVRVSLRDRQSGKYIGSDEAWNKSENALRKAVQECHIPYAEEPGEAAFYGPKIDFVIRDVIGREWQLGTIQVDYNLPERFNLNYIGADNQPHRPVMIHRAPFGSLERFCGLLIEHFAGDFPLWLAPEHVRLLPLNDDLIPYAKQVQQELGQAGLRVSIDERSEKLNAKIRRAEMDRMPYCAVLGQRERENQMVSIRSRIHPSEDGTLPLQAFSQRLLEHIGRRDLPESFHTR